jgi:hypothetical protein
MVRKKLQDIKKVDNDLDLSNLKVFKLLGWCPSDGCNAFLSSGDFIDKRDRKGNKLLRCLKCKREISEIKLLKEEKKGLDRLSYADRSEYLSNLDDYDIYDEEILLEKFNDYSGEDYD